jgi:hypothetical protein
MMQRFNGNGGMAAQQHHDDAASHHYGKAERHYRKERFGSGVVVVREWRSWSEHLDN